MDTPIASSDYKRLPVRCESDDPHACVACRSFLAMPGSDRCPLHPTHADHEVTQHRQALYNIKKTELAARLQGMKAHPESRSLANELGLLRLTLEEIINKCKDDYDLVMNEAAISRLVTTIQAALLANQKIEERVGELLSLDNVVTLIQMFFEIVKEFVRNPDDQETIAKRINIVLQGRQYVNPE